MSLCIVKGIIVGSNKEEERLKVELIIHLN
jgi:hypothetical protein